MDQLYGIWVKIFINERYFQRATNDRVIDRQNTEGAWGGGEAAVVSTVTGYITF